jgi:hypothetical protein
MDHLAPPGITGALIRDRTMRAVVAMLALVGFADWGLAANPPAALLPVPVGGPLSWVTTSAPNPDATRSGARVFLLRGTGMVFSPEFGTLCTRLRQAGLWAEDLPSGGDAWVCQQLLAERRAGRPTGPVVLVGHSRGGRHIIYAARALEKAGIAVDLIVCLDVAMPPTVPGNVGRAVNVYMTRNRVYPAGTLAAARGSAAQIENLDLSEPGGPISLHGLHHFNITASPAVQDLVIQRVLEVAHEAAQQPAVAACPVH